MTMEAFDFDSSLNGLSPSCLAHVPMCVSQLQSLDLVNGCTYMVVLGKSETRRVVPVSRCTLVGVLVHVAQKSDFAFSFILDDGTGVVDGLYSILCFEEDYILHKQSIREAQQKQLRVGDTVRVFGTISCMSLGKEQQTQEYGDIFIRSRTRSVFEIHASRIEVLSSYNTATPTSHLAEEANHWMKSLRNIAAPPGTLQQSLHTPNDMMHLIGPKLRQNITSNAKHSGKRTPHDGLHKSTCKCKLPYKDALLYCHCNATMEKLDPLFIYRGKLLSELIAMETSLLSCNESIESPFRFQYKSIVQNKTLLSTAARVVSDTSTPSLNAQRLVVLTFQALRRDGIIALVDEPSDTYILISRRSVMEPLAIRRASHPDHQPNPSYLSLIPPSRRDVIESFAKQRFLQLQTSEQESCCSKC